MTISIVHESMSRSFCPPLYTSGSPFCSHAQKMVHQSLNPMLVRPSMRPNVYFTTPSLMCSYSLFILYVIFGLFEPLDLGNYFPLTPRHIIVICVKRSTTHLLPFHDFYSRCRSNMYSSVFCWPLIVHSSHDGALPRWYYQFRI